MSRDQDPLSPEERALAEALARAAPRRGPPPQVDAAILASARSALRKDGVAPGRSRRRRWPAVLGVAASLALAVGIAWQLRPAPDDALPPVTEGPPARPAARPAEAPAASEARGFQAAESAAIEKAPPPLPAAASEPEAVESPPQPEAQKQASPAREQAVLSAPAQDPVPPPPPPAPPAPPVPAPDPPVVADQPPPAGAAADRTRARQQAAPRPAAARSADGPAAAAAAPAAESRDDAGTDGAGIVFDRRALHDGPPATVDSPAIHRAWLDRIRELRDAGELEAARESLREYRRRYPGQALPDDLDGLLDE